MHAEYALLALPVVALLQVYLSYIIQSKFFSSGSKFRSTRRTRLLLAIWSLLAPPLFLDWDYLYRQGGFSITITECWERSKKVLLLHHLITLLGNMVLVLASIPFLLQINLNHIPPVFATMLGISFAINGLFRHQIR